MISALKRSPGNTLELTVTIPWSDIKAIYAKIENKLLDEIELPGFRKGKAPRDLTLKQLEKTKIYEEVLKEIIPDFYVKAIQEQDVKPIIAPKVSVLEAKENSDWKVLIMTCEQPIIVLGKYRDTIAKLRAAKQQKIWVPGEDKKDEKKDELSLGEVLDAIYKDSHVEISELIIEQEVNRSLANLIDQTQKLGMTIESYLQAQGKTSDQIRNEYKDQATKTLALEFILEEIANQEKIVVENAEIDDFIKNAKSEEEKKSLESQKYYIGSILRRQKTVQSLLKESVIKAK